MRFDLSGFLPENLVPSEQLSVAGNLTDGYVAVLQNLFYEHDFQLVQTTPADGSVTLERGVDYKFVFIVPGYRNRDKRFAAYAAVEILNRQQAATYRASYRAVGASMRIDPVEMRRFFLDNDESSNDFFGLLIEQAYAPDAERLADASLLASGVLISYQTVVGAMESAAKKLSSQTQETGTTTTTGTEVGDATATSKGVIQLSGDLTGTAARPRVVGLEEKIDAVFGDARYALKDDVKITINGVENSVFDITAQSLGVYSSLQIDQMLSALTEAMQTLSASVVKSVNGATPNNAGEVTITVIDETPIDGGQF